MLIRSIRYLTTLMTCAPRLPVALVVGYRKAMARFAGIVILFLGSAVPVSAELAPETLSAWERYGELTGARIAAELEGSEGFLAMDFFDVSERSDCERRIRSGEVCVLKRRTLDEEGRAIDVPEGLIHHWYGSILVPDVAVARVIDFVQDYENSARFYPEVEESRLIAKQADVFDIFLRLRRKKVITVHYNTEHRVVYRRHGGARFSSKSVATRIRELANPGEGNEREKAPGQDQGFLWGLSSYWRFEETPAGTIVECESVSLSRSVPAAARWLVKNFLDSVPRESLESTLLPIREHLAR